MHSQSLMKSGKKSRMNEEWEAEREEEIKGREEV